MENSVAVPPQLVVMKHGRRHTVLVTDITYVEAVDKYSLIHCNGEVYLLNDSLKTLAARYPDLLICIHRKFLVSKTRIYQFTRRSSPSDSSLTLKDNKQIFPVSRRRASKVATYMQSFKI